MIRHRGAAAPPQKSALRENLESLIWAIIIATLIRAFIIAPFKIPSGSMRPTLIEGDRILVSRFLFRFREPARGEIVGFRSPIEPKRPLIKRLIATGGDRVEIRHGRLWVNGEDLTAVLPNQTSYVNDGPYGAEGNTVEVPEGMFYVLGDNSSSSHDSRFWGFVPRRFLIGKALCIFWPLNRIRALR